MKFGYTFIFAWLFLASCSIEKNVISEPISNEVQAPVSEEEVEITYKVSYSSTKGVMTKLSCYDGNLTIQDGVKVLVCFDNKADVSNYENLTVTGHYTSKDLKSNGNNACPDGQLQFFKVTSFKCE